MWQIIELLTLKTTTNRGYDNGKAKNQKEAENL